MKEIQALNRRSRSILGAKLIQQVKRFMGEEVENDLKKYANSHNFRSPGKKREKKADEADAFDANLIEQINRRLRNFIS